MQNKNINKTKKGQTTEKKIFDAALDLIKVKGFENTTIIDICEAAGVSNGSFYHHFNSKQDILINYIKQESTDLINYYKSLDKESYSAALQIIVKYQISYFIIKGYDFVTNFYSIMLLSKNSYYDFSSFAIRKILLDCFENGQKNKEFSDKFSAQFMSDTAFSLLYTSSTAWCMAEGNFDLHEDVRKNFLMLAEAFKSDNSSDF